MKAYMTFNGDPCDGCLLVYAESRNKARSTSLGAFFSWDYIEISAIRKPLYDRYYKEGISIIVDNQGLPIDAPDFYSDIEF